MLTADCITMQHPTLCCKQAGTQLPWIWLLASLALQPQLCLGHAKTRLFKQVFALSQSM